MRVDVSSKFPLKIWASDLDLTTRIQALETARMPFIHKHVALMPDAHLGKGSTVGSVIATKGAIIPAAVGGDIGCGMQAEQLGLCADDLGGDKFLARLRDSIESKIPVGQVANSSTCDAADAFMNSGTAHWKRVGENNASKPLADQYRLRKEHEKLQHKARLQFGSLGGGNHFIELCLDQNDSIWLVLHSGSRGIGNHLASRHIDRAKGLMRQYFIETPNPDLAYLVQKTPEFDAYLDDLLWCQQYAMENRSEMMRRFETCLTSALGGRSLDVQRRVHCHHNYTRLENHFGANIYVTRKGAVSAREGEWGIIPGSMGTRTYIVQGKGNPESFMSCAHGAGRRMSRNQARREFTLDDLIRQTAGVECRKDDALLDEIPGAYKDVDQVMADQADLVDVRYTLRAVLCVKG